MNLKSYARGIGAGLIVAALVLGTGGKTEKMTDSQIISRAKELGLIEAQTLTQISTEASTDDTASEENDDSKENVSENTSASGEPAPEFKEKDEVTVEPIISDTTETSESEETSETSPETSPETSTDISVETSTEISVSEEPEIEIPPLIEGETVTLTINKGDSSVIVARRCYELGIIESAPELDKYLCQNNYDRKISVGTYTIAVGASFEDIAKIITRQ